jgi:hypothetical protein
VISSTERFPERADFGPSVLRVNVAGAEPGRTTATVMTAFPAWMHCIPRGQRLSDNSAVNVTETPAPATETDSPTFTENASPRATVRTLGTVVVGAVVGGAVVGAVVVRLVLGEGCAPDVDEPPPPHAALIANRAPAAQAYALPARRPAAAPGCSIGS